MDIKIICLLSVCYNQRLLPNNLPSKLGCYPEIYPCNAGTTIIYSNANIRDLACLKKLPGLLVIQDFAPEIMQF